MSQESKIDDIEHAIRSPLCSIQMAAQLLSEEQIGTLTEKQRKLVNILLADIDKLTKNLLYMEIIKDEPKSN